MVIKRKNDDIYILANSDNINGREIYHFINTKIVDYWMSDDNAKPKKEKDIPVFSMFCTEENGKYVEIEDSEEITNLLEKFGMVLGPIIASGIKNSIEDIIKLKFPDVFPYGTYIKGRQREEFIDEQKNNLKGIKEKLGVDLDLEKINKRLDKIRVKEFEEDMPNGVLGFYNANTDTVYYKANQSKIYELINDRIKLHEVIHYLAGINYTRINAFNKAILEGMNENVVCDYLDDGMSSIRIYGDKGSHSNIKQASIQYNFNYDTTYEFDVSTVKQLEYIIGMKSYDSAINGNGNFLKAIIKELGPIDAIMLFANLNRLHSIQREMNGCKIVSVTKFENIQNDLLRKCFNKRFKAINSVEDAQEYMEKLRNFETYRGKITYLNRDGTIEENDTFRKYYQEKYNSLLSRFKENSDVLEEYKYKEQEYRTTLDQSPEYRISLIKSMLLCNMLKEAKGNFDAIPRNLQISMQRNADFYFIYNINGKQLDKEEAKKYYYVGQNSLLELNSVKLRNPDDSVIEQYAKFIDDIKNKGEKFESETLDINFTEEEIQDVYSVLEENEKKKEEFKEKNQLKKITFIDRIRNKINSIFKTKRKIYDNQTNKSMSMPSNNSNTKESNKLPSWDLRNWSKEELEGQKKREASEKNPPSRDSNEDNKRDNYDK